MNSPLTPQQALQNFHLLKELSPRNTYEEYREAIHEIADIVIEKGIQGDNLHPTREQALEASLRQALAFISASYPEGLDSTDSTVTLSADDAPEITFQYAAALALLTAH